MEMQEKITYRKLFKMLTETVPRVLREDEMSISMTAIEDGEEWIYINDDNVSVEIKVKVLTKDD